jgi:aldehyde:ferredoxin oxidoreductase
MTNEITGIDLDRESLFSLGLTRLCLQRLLNGVLGATADEDDLPDYFFNTPINADMKGVDTPIFGNQDTSNVLNSGLYSAALSRENFLTARAHVYHEFGWSEREYVDKSHPIAKEALKIQRVFNDKLERLTS